MHHMMCICLFCLYASHDVYVRKSCRSSLFLFQNELSRIVCSENLERIEVSLISGVHSSTAITPPVFRPASIGLGKWYLQEVPITCNVGKECQAKFSQKLCTGRGMAGISHSCLCLYKNIILLKQATGCLQRKDL